MSYDDDIKDKLEKGVFRKVFEEIVKKYYLLFSTKYYKCLQINLNSL